MILLYFLKFVVSFVNDDFLPMMLVQFHLKKKKIQNHQKFKSRKILHLARTPITHQTAVTIEIPYQKNKSHIFI